MAAKAPNGVHRVAKRLADGTRRYYFYAWRGGPRFWQDSSSLPGCSEFFTAYAAAVSTPKPEIYSTPKMVDDFLSSTAMPKGERTRADYRKWALRFAEEFADDPAALFAIPGSRAEMNKWRKKWAHSPRLHDYAGTVAVRILNWARDEGLIEGHHCDRLHKIYKAERAEIVWTPEDRAMIENVAPDWVRRIVVAGCETGLRPHDLSQIHRGQVELTPHGRRLKVRTRKRNKYAYIPVTTELGAVIDQTPSNRTFILASASGKALTARAASNAVMYWRERAGVPKSEDGREKTLQDMRGTAATRLLNAGLSLNEIATHMGWSVRHAANVIEHYAMVSTTETDGILVKLQASMAK